MTRIKGYAHRWAGYLDPGWGPLLKSLPGSRLPGRREGGWARQAELENRALNPKRERHADRLLRVLEVGWGRTHQHPGPGS